MLRALLAGISLVIVALVEAPAAHAEVLPEHSLDELSDEADVVVEAVPESQEALRSAKTEDALARFRVVTVLKGRAVRRDDLVAVRRMGLHLLTNPIDPPPEVPQVERALLFLKNDVPVDGAARFELLFSGVRYVTDRREVLRPEQWLDSSYVLRPSPGVTWEGCLAWVKADLARSEGVRALRRIDDPAERNAAVVAWLREHQAELAAAPRRTFAHADGPGGYGGAVDAAVNWVLASGDATQAWEALALWNRARTGDRPEDKAWRFPEEWRDARAFQSSAGRTLLLRVAQDPNPPLEERLFALKVLGDYRTQGGYDSVLPRGLAPATREEHEAQVEALRRLADEGRPASVREAARAIHAHLSQREATVRPRRRQDELLAAYRRPAVGEHEGVERNWVACQLAGLLDDAAWQALSGNPRGIVVTFYLFEPDERGGRLQVAGGRMPTPVFEKPDLVLERLGDDGAVLESRRMPLPLIGQEPSWEKGWEGGGEAVFPTTGLATGLWRVTLVGAAGSAKLAWKSEAQAFRWPRPAR